MFIFTANEKVLGIEILNSIIPDSDSGKKAIQNAVRDIKYAGVEIPKNVHPLH